MLNFDGPLIAGVLTDQQLGQTFNEILASRGERKREAGPTEQDYVNLRNAYTQLVARFNAVLDENREVDKFFDETIAARDRELAAKDEHIAGLEKDGDRLRQLFEVTRKHEVDLACALSEANQRLKNAGLEPI